MEESTILRKASKGRAILPSRRCFRLLLTVKRIVSPYFRTAWKRSSKKILVLKIKRLKHLLKETSHLRSSDLLPFTMSFNEPQFMRSHHLVDPAASKKPQQKKNMWPCGRCAQRRKKVRLMSLGTTLTIYFSFLLISIFAKHSLQFSVSLSLHIHPSNVKTVQRQEFQNARPQSLARFGLQIHRASRRLLLLLRYHQRHLNLSVTGTLALWFVTTFFSLVYVRIAHVIIYSRLCGCRSKEKPIGSRITSTRIPDWVQQAAYTSRTLPMNEICVHWTPCHKLLASIPINISALNLPSLFPIRVISFPRPHLNTSSSLRTLLTNPIALFLCP